MEERIIDEEYGRGIRLKKTKDGYTDVEDETAKETSRSEDGEENGEENEEVVFEFPELDEDDEELATLTAEEAAELKKQREELRKKRQAEYEGFVERGKAYLEAGDFQKASVEFAAGMLLVPDHEEAAIGLWRARTENFSNPDEMVSEYAEHGDDAFEEFRYEAGEDAVKRLAEEYGAVFKTRLQELAAERAPIEEGVEKKRSERREILSVRKKKHNVFFFSTLVPALLFLILGLIFAGKINTRPDKVFLWVTVGFFSAFAVVFFVFLVAAKKRIDTARIIRLNEDLSSTEEGARLVKIRLAETFYRGFID